jgi:hypothetical protein
MVVDSWKLAIDKGEKVVCAFLDLRKAFDTINHKVLLNKLMKYGVKDREYDWFAYYLSGRSQFVSYQDVQSDKRSISYGVPQGSVLGPTLFNVYINGISYVCENSNTFLYADDTEIHPSSKDIGIAERCVNEDLTQVDDWLSRNGLISNHKKSEVMLIGSRYAISNARDLQITLSGKILKQSRFFKYLGVYMDHLLKWNKQVNYITGRVCHKLTMLNRVSKFLSSSVLLRIYKQTILPIFDYGCIVWGDLW